MTVDAYSIEYMLCIFKYFAPYESSWYINQSVLLLVNYQIFPFHPFINLNFKLHTVMALILLIFSCILWSIEYFICSWLLFNHMIVFIIFNQRGFPLYLYSIKYSITLIFFRYIFNHNILNQHWALSACLTILIK